METVWQITCVEHEEGWFLCYGIHQEEKVILLGSTNLINENHVHPIFARILVTEVFQVGVPILTDYSRTTRLIYQTVMGYIEEGKIQEREGLLYWIE